MKKAFTLLKFSCLLFLIFPFAGCETTKNNFPVLFQADLSSLSSTAMEDKFILKQIIPLDTAALLNSGKINNITILDDKIFISSYEDPDIYIFNAESGRLEYSINRSGRGAGEYSATPGIVMYAGKNLLIEDFAGAINYYDLHGNYKSRTSDIIAGNKLFSITNTNDSTFLVSKELLGLYFYKDQSEPYYSVDLISGEGKILKKMLERDATLPKIPVKSVQSQFYKFQDQIYLCPLTENNIYHFNGKDSTLKCIYSFDITGANVNTAFDEQRLNSTAVFWKKVYMLSIVAITDRYMLITAGRQKGENRYILIDKQDKGITVYDRNADTDMNLGRFISNDKGLVIQLADYFDLTDGKGTIKNTPLINKIKQKINIDENMNPVLCIYTGK